MKGCHDIISEHGIENIEDYQDACKYWKKGWLLKNGQIRANKLKTRFHELDSHNVSDNIASCLKNGLDYASGSGKEQQQHTNVQPFF